MNERSIIIYGHNLTRESIICQTIFLNVVHNRIERLTCIDTPLGFHFKLHVVIFILLITVTNTYP